MLLVRILVCDIADEHSLLPIPSLEVSASEIHQVFAGLVEDAVDVLFRYVADAFVLGPTNPIRARSDI
jgi:hypothetical protein